jgi:hypothetical protein
VTPDHTNPRRRRAGEHPEKKRAHAAGPLIDALLDGELSEDRSRDALRRIRHDATASEDLARTRIAIDRLRSPIQTPDLSDAILGQVHARRRFLPTRTRNFVTAGRLAVAAGLVGAIGIASLVQRHAPDVRLLSEPSAVDRLVHAVVPSTQDRPMLTEQSLQTFQTAVGKVPPPASAGRLSLNPQIRPNEWFGDDLANADQRTTVLSFTTPLSDAPPASPIASNSSRPRPTIVTQAAPNAMSPLQMRFRPLMSFLREPPKPLDTEAAGSDD